MDLNELWNGVWTISSYLIVGLTIVGGICYCAGKYLKWQVNANEPAWVKYLIRSVGFLIIVAAFVKVFFS